MKNIFQLIELLIIFFITRSSQVSDWHVVNVWIIFWSRISATWLTTAPPHLSNANRQANNLQNLFPLASFSFIFRVNQPGMPLNKTGCRFILWHQSDSLKKRQMNWTTILIPISIRLIIARDNIG